MSPDTIKIAIIGGGEQIGRAALIQALLNDERVTVLMDSMEMTVEQVAERVELMQKEMDDQKQDRIRLVESMSMINDLRWEPAAEFDVNPQRDAPHWLQYGNKRGIYKCR